MTLELRPSLSSGRRLEACQERHAVRAIGHCTACLIFKTWQPERARFLLSKCQLSNPTSGGNCRMALNGWSV